MEKDTLEIILGENIARYRNLAGMTQGQLAECVGTLAFRGSIFVPVPEMDFLRLAPPPSPEWSVGSRW